MHVDQDFMVFGRRFFDLFELKHIRRSVACVDHRVHAYGFPMPAARRGVERVRHTGHGGFLLVWGFDTNGHGAYLRCGPVPAVNAAVGAIDAICSMYMEHSGMTVVPDSYLSRVGGMVVRSCAGS